MTSPGDDALRLALSGGYSGRAPKKTAASQTVLRQKYRPRANSRQSGTRASHAKFVRYSYPSNIGVYFDSAVWCARSLVTDLLPIVVAPVREDCACKSCVRTNCISHACVLWK
eukprot:2917-Pleurochrysis_carterae.AAC.9